MKYEVFIKREGEWYLADVPALPGCISQGRSEEEVLLNIRKIIADHMQADHSGSPNAARPRIVKVEFPEYDVEMSNDDINSRDPILQLSGLGKELWAGIDPDEHVRREREAWG